MVVGKKVGLLERPSRQPGYQSKGCLLLSVVFQESCRSLWSLLPLGEPKQTEYREGGESPICSNSLRCNPVQRASGPRPPEHAHEKRMMWCSL